MKLKRRGRTTEIKFDNRAESIAFLEAMGLHKTAEALRKVEASKKAEQQPMLPGMYKPGDRVCYQGFYAEVERVLKNGRLVIRLSTGAPRTVKPESVERC